MWNFIISDMFIPTYCFNNKLVNKLDFLLTKEEKRKVKISFKVKYLIISAPSTRNYLCVFSCISAKEV